MDNSILLSPDSYELLKYISSQPDSLVTNVSELSEDCLSQLVHYKLIEEHITDYYSCINVLEREEAEDIFHLFDAYMQELLNNYRDNHSHQWTDIEFQRLKEFFDSSVFAFEND